MEITKADIAKSLPKVIEAGNAGTSPEWLTKMQEVVKGINDMIGFYRELSGKPPPASPGGNEEKLGFSEARAMKKAEMAERKGQPPANPPASNEFQELLAGLAEACRTLEGMGGGKKPIGEIIIGLPFTLTQVREFLDKLYKSKYGG